MASLPTEKEMGIKILGKMEFNTASDLEVTDDLPKEVNTSLCASQTHRSLAQQTISHLIQSATLSCSTWYMPGRWSGTRWAQVTGWSCCLWSEAIRWQILLSNSKVMVFDGVKKMESNQDHSSKMHETYLYITISKHVPQNHWHGLGMP